MGFIFLTCTLLALIRGRRRDVCLRDGSSTSLREVFLLPSSRSTEQDKCSWKRWCKEEAFRELVIHRACKRLKCRKVRWVGPALPPARDTYTCHHGGASRKINDDWRSSLVLSYHSAMNLVGSDCLGSESAARWVGVAGHRKAFGASSVFAFCACLPLKQAHDYFSRLSPIRSQPFLGQGFELERSHGKLVGNSETKYWATVFYLKA